MKPRGSPRWLSSKPKGASLEGSTGSRSSSASERSVEVDLAILVDGVPHRERNPEETLTGDVPVEVETFDPRSISMLHVVGVPTQLLAATKQRLADLEGPDEPLARRDDLQGALTAFVELDLMSDLAGSTDECALCAKGVHDGRCAAWFTVAPSIAAYCSIASSGSRDGELRRRKVGGKETPVTTDERAGWQL